MQPPPQIPPPQTTPSHGALPHRPTGRETPSLDPPMCSPAIASRLPENKHRVQGIKITSPSFPCRALGTVLRWPGAPTNYSPVSDSVLSPAGSARQQCATAHPGVSEASRTPSVAPGPPAFPSRRRPTIIPLMPAGGSAPAVSVRGPQASSIKDQASPCPSGAAPS